MVSNTKEAPKNPLCQCGSGLSHARCCALQQVTRVSPGHVKAMAPGMRQAREQHQQGNPQAAAELCTNILEQAPAHVDALRLLAAICKEADKKQALETLLKRLVKLEANDGDLACELAMVLYQRGDHAGAEYHARNGIRLMPRNPQAHSLLGMAFTDQGRSLAGEYHYRRALELHKPLGKLYANLGLNLRNQGKLDEAEACYRQAVELEPDNTTTLLGWLRLEESRCEFDRAWKLLEQAQKVGLKRTEVAMNRATLYGRAKEYDKALVALDTIPGESSEKGPGIGYFMERGKVLDKLGRYDEAFADYDEANRLIREAGRGDYKESAPRMQARRLKSFFVRTRMEILPRAGTRDACAQPLFIIGFPRSGTTMTEQILTAHPEVCAGDELTFIGDLSRFGAKLLNSPLTYPDSFAELWMGDNQGALDDFRDWYLKRTQQLGILEQGARLFTDKMPLNETHLGLIHLVFPEAPVVHLHRHPLDVVLSSFFTDMTHGNRCSYQLETAAQHYVLTMDLVEHYKRELDLNYKAVRYEDLVSDQENHVRQLLEFIGVPWDESCLNFHENKRYARTASYAQVTEKLYTSSRFRYKKYRKHLEGVIPILEPVIEQLGYTIED